MTDRLAGAVLAISVITLAELRAGFIYAKWGPRRTAETERRVSSYLLVGLDMTIVNEWASLDAALKSIGTKVPHNDLWIAATLHRLFRS